MLNFGFQNFILLIRTFGLTNLFSLTINIETDSLADGGWDIIAGNAEIRPHLSPRDTSYGQIFSLKLLLPLLPPARVPDNVLPILSPPCDPGFRMS